MLRIFKYQVDIGVMCTIWIGKTMASDEVRSHGIEGIEGRIRDRSAFIYLKHTHLTGKPCNQDSGRK